MIRRTVLEWRKLPYGDGVDAIPPWAADRIAHAARMSPIGGEEGTQILQHGRNALRAQQVVGVIAAEECALEILPKIDGLGDGSRSDTEAAIRRNLVHMLAAVLDLNVAAGNVTELGWQHENLLEILIRLFCNRLFEAVHRGMPRRYVDCEEDLAALRGRLDVVRQFTTLASNPQMLACRYDSLSSDIALNQIMKAAVSRLLRLSRSADHQRRLRELSLAYADVTDVAVNALRWDQVVLDRTNARWRELITLAKLLLGDRFQTTTIGPGRGFSLLFAMNTLFEEYVGCMLRKVLCGTGLSVDLQGGRLHCLTALDDTRRQRFMTRPDIIVRRGAKRLLIIDTKWKRLSPVVDDPKQGVGQGDVYQLMAYGRLYSCPQLMLLYPHHYDLRCPEGITSRHRVNGSHDELSTATIDLSDVRSVPARLDALVRPLLLGAHAVPVDD